MKKSILGGLVFFLIIIANAYGDNQSVVPPNRVVIDSKGNHVEIPYKVTKVVNLWNSANEILIQLGAGDIFVGGSMHLRKRPWMTRIFPKAKNIAVISQGGAANTEAVLALDPDFTLSIAGRADALIEIGEPVIQLGVEGTVEGLLKQIGMIAEALGPEYQANAEKFFTYFRSNLRYVAQKTADIPDNEKVRVLHGATSSTVIDESLLGNLLNLINVKNAFQKTKSRTISYEGILKANPEVIIVATGRYKEYEKFMTDSIYADVTAVKNRKVFINPSGMFLWDAFSGEIALEVLWLAKTIYPSKFRELDMHKEVRKFYKLYFDYAMSDSEITYLLAGKGPDGQWQ